MKRIGFAAVTAFSLAVGFVLGAASIHRPIPNTPLELPSARHPWSSKDIMGLLGSAGIRIFAGHLKAIPFVVLETEKTFALTVSADKARFHYVLVPKKDIQDTGKISAEDGLYLTDIFLTARQLVEKEDMRDYRIYTNGAGLQSVGYLHFHLVGKRGSQ